MEAVPQGPAIQGLGHPLQNGANGVGANGRQQQHVAVQGNAQPQAAVVQPAALAAEENDVDWMVDYDAPNADEEAEPGVADLPGPAAVAAAVPAAPIDVRFIKYESVRGKQVPTQLLEIVISDLSRGAPWEHCKRQLLSAVQQCSPENTFMFRQATTRQALLDALNTYTKESREEAEAAYIKQRDEFIQDEKTSGADMAKKLTALMARRAAAGYSRWSYRELLDFVKQRLHLDYSQQWPFPEPDSFVKLRSWLRGIDGLIVQNRRKRGVSTTAAQSSAQVAAVNVQSKGRPGHIRKSPYYKGDFDRNRPQPERRFDGQRKPQFARNENAGSSKFCQFCGVFRGHASGPYCQQCGKHNGSRQFHSSRQFNGNRQFHRGSDDGFRHRGRVNAGPAQMNDDGDSPGWDEQVFDDDQPSAQKNGPANNAVGP